MRSKFVALEQVMFEGVVTKSSSLIYHLGDLNSDLVALLSGKGSSFTNDTMVKSSKLCTRMSVQASKKDIVTRKDYGKKR